MIISAVIVGVAAVLAAIIGIWNRQKLNQIHVLVNSRLQVALDEISDLKRSLRYERTQGPVQNVDDNASKGDSDTHYPHTGG